METNWPAKGIATLTLWNSSYSPFLIMETNWPAKGIATSVDYFYIVHIYMETNWPAKGIAT